MFIVRQKGESQEHYAEKLKSAQNAFGYDIGWSGERLEQRSVLLDSIRESRDADCGRQEGGKFGPGNKCQEDGDGTAVATQDADRRPTSQTASVWDSSESVGWDKSSSTSPPPFAGSDRFSYVGISSPVKVSETLESMGMEPEEVLSAIGAPDGSAVSIRPGNEYSRTAAFRNSVSTPIFVSIESDVAGVPRGVEGSSVIGEIKDANGEAIKVIHHNTVSVSDEVKAEPAKRHAAARGFYTAMVSSVENARKSGVARIVMNAAGSSRQGEAGTMFGKGYTIWPRMGFDAPLPPDIKRQLPSTLSHAQSLLDLHATPEGTRWWADNGYDIDVSIDLRDRSSPQNKVLDRFVRHFSKSKRSIPLGSGDDWLSPEDMLKLDRLWQEIWDEGDLDDYEWIEPQSANNSKDL